MTRATTMSPFRLFGRTSRDEHLLDDGPDPWLDDPAPAPAPRPVPPRAREAFPAPSTGGMPPAPTTGTAALPTEGPATAAARPALWTPRRPPQEPIAEPEPVTDPFGFPPVPPPAAATSTPAPVSDEVTAAWAAWAPAAVSPAEGGADRAASGAASPAPVTTTGTPPTTTTGTTTGTTTAAPGPAPSGPEHGPASRPAGAPDASTRTAPGTAAPSSAPADPSAGSPAPSPSSAAPPPDPAEPSPSPADPTPGRADPSSGRSDPSPVPAGARPATGSPVGTAPPSLVDPAEASALAGAFAADLLSWDEDDVDRRARVLAAYLPATAADGLLGWTGTGRQRADLVLPGRVRADADRAVVDVRVRVVPYRRVDARGTAAPEPEPDDPIGAPAGAPAPAARGWRGLAARWVRLEVAVALTDDGLVVDAGPAAEPARRPSPVDLARGGVR